MNTLSSSTISWRSVWVALTASAITAAAIPMNAIAQSEGGRVLATGSHIPLSPSAPDQYTVKQGDTLWGISQLFLIQPWYWPELWYLNPQIKNPHRIYPGDVLKLVNVDGQTRLTITERGPVGTAAETTADVGSGQVIARGNGSRVSPQIRSTPLPQSVTTIPYNVIASFMSRPSVVPSDEVKSGPHVMGFREHRIMASAGEDVYIRGIKDAEEGARYNIVHIEDELKDPESGRKMGYRGIYVGSGEVTQSGDPAKVRLHESSMEALRGDRVFAENFELNADFVPHAPKEEIKGRIFHVAGVNVVGQYQIVAINRGAENGVEAGNVLSIWQRGEVVKDSYGDARTANHMNQPSGGSKVKLPNENIGTVLVFKAYKHMSFALIMQSTSVVHEGDLIRNP